MVDGWDGLDGRWGDGRLHDRWGGRIGRIGHRRFDGIGFRRGLGGGFRGGLGFGKEWARAVEAEEVAGHEAGQGGDGVGEGQYGAEEFQLAIRRGDDGCCWFRWG